MKLLSTLLLALLPTVAAAQLTWQQIGPYGGNVTRIAEDSTGALFAMADNGIYRSTDNGTTWTPGTGVPLGVTFVDFTIARNGTYFASTANAGVYRSTNQGIAWETAREGLPQSFAWSIEASPVADEVLVSTGPGVYRTTDNGTSWALTGNERITRPVLFAPDGVAFVAVDSGVMRSSDAARATWEWTDSTATPTPITGMFLAGADTLWAGTESSGVYRSVDRGVTWQARNTGLNVLEVEAIDPGYAGELYVSTSDGALYRSTDEGELWVRVTPTVPQFVASSILRASTDRLFSTSPKGIFYTDAHAIGVAWLPSRTGILNSVPRTVIVTDDDLLTLQFTGVFHRRARSGGEWSIVDLDIPPGSAVSGLALDSSGGLIATVNGVGLYHSGDRGATWRRWSDGFPLTQPTLRPTAIAAGQGDILFVGSADGMIYRSTDGGIAWERDTLSTARNASVNAIAVRGTTVFAGMEAGLFISRDGGATWTESPLSMRTYSIALGTAENVYVGSFQGRVYRSSDDGATWSFTTTTPTAPLVSAVGVNAAGNVLAGVQPGGMYLSRDAGATWMRVNEGLMNPAVTSIAIGTDGRAYAGTYGGGVHESVESTLGVTGEARAGGSSMSISPSPASDHALVELELLRGAHVRVDLFDATGKHVSSLHDGMLGAGPHSFTLDAARFAVGAYRVRAMVDGVAVQTPVIVVR